MTLSPNDPGLTWLGHISLERAADYTRPWRIPCDERRLFFPSLATAAATQAGVRLAFHSSTRRLCGWILPLENNQRLDLMVNREFFGSLDLAGRENFVFEDLPPGEKHLELWLPQRGDFALRRIELDEDASIRPAEDNRPRWITHGSSITHCRDAASPSRTWPAIVARERNLNLTCLGYGGQCHLDAQIALMIRDRPVDFLSLCAGINIYGNGSLNARSFPSALIGFVKIVREKHPEIPFLLISPIYGAHRETTPNKVGWMLQDYRAAVEETAGKLRHHGDLNLHYLSGLRLFDESKAHLLPDNLHPNAEGYEWMARNFLLYAGPLLFASP